MKSLAKLCYIILILLLIMPMSSNALWPTPNKEAVKKVIEANKNYGGTNCTDVIPENLYDRGWKVDVNMDKHLKFSGCDIKCMSPGVLVLDCTPEGTIIIMDNVIISRGK